MVPLATLPRSVGFGLRGRACLSTPLRSMTGGSGRIASPSPSTMSVAKSRFSTSPTSRQSSSPSSSSHSFTSASSSSKDPSHPHLYYHQNHTHLSLSFLPHPPSSSRSKTVIGYLPSRPDATLQDFKEEPRFLDVLHDAIKSGLEQGKAQSVIFEAETRPTDGWIHITDERALPPAGRIGETEDLIGSVYVQEGKIVASTYSPLPTYRTVTPNGVLTLPKGLDEHLISILENIDEEERGSA